LAPGSLDKLDGLLQERPDVVSIAINWDGNVRDAWEGIEGPLSGIEATVCLAEKQPFPLAMAQQYVCRTDFLREKKLQFVNGIVHEDEEFYPRLLYSANTVLPSHLPLYLYSTREDSITTASRARNVVAIADIMRRHLAFWREVKPSTAVTSAWNRTWLTMFFFIFFHPRASAATPSAKTREALKGLVAGDGGEELKAFVAFASRPKRLGVAMIRFAAATGILWPTRLFFALYYWLCESKTGK